MSGLGLLPDHVRNLYEVHEWRNACAVLKGAHPDEWDETMQVLTEFRLRETTY